MRLRADDASGPAVRRRAFFCSFVSFIVEYITVHRPARLTTLAALASHGVGNSRSGRARSRAYP